YRTLYENMPGVFYRANREGDILMINPPGAKLLGYHSPEEMIGKNIAKDIYYIPENRKSFLDELEKRKGTVKDYEVVLKRRDGTPVNISTSSHYYYDSEGNIAGVEGIFTDITDRKKAEIAIRHEQSLLRALMDNVPDFIYFKDEKNRFVKVNKRSAEDRGITPEDFIGKTDFDIFTEEVAKKCFADDDRVIKTGKPLINKIEKITYLNGIERWFSATKVPRYDEKGQIIGTIGVARDITERKQNEQLQQVLYNISKAANSHITLDQLYPIIHQELGTIIDTSNFYIALIDEKENKLYFPYHIDELEDDFKPQNLEDKSLTCYIIKNKRSALLNYDKIKKLKKKGKLLDIGVITKDIFWFGVPLKVEDKIIGVMTVQSYCNSNPYSEKDTTLLEFVSSQVATAIDRKRMEEELEKMAHYDSLTGVHNRGYGLELLQRQLKLSKRDKSPLLLAYSDLDNLKDINDKFGHEEGDIAMIKVAKLFKSILREVDIITRMGGDEFLVIFLGSTLNEIPIIKKRLSKELTRLNRISKKPYKVEFSTGFSNYDPDNPLSMDELIRVADEKMYEEKKRKNKGR
ncbi:MAG: diguanylate cyclase, partial [Atribacterota bacterium]|nr:diguanylate cyclase [Atribacterota bacterium]